MKKPEILLSDYTVDERKPVSTPSMRNTRRCTLKSSGVSDHFCNTSFAVVDMQKKKTSPHRTETLSLPSQIFTEQSVVVLFKPCVNGLV